MKRRIAILLLTLFVLAQSTVASAQDNGAATQKVYLPAISAGSNTEQVEQPGDSPSLVVRIYFKDRGQLNELVQRLDVFEEATTAGYAVAYVSQNELEQLQTEGVQVEIDETRTAAINASIDTMKQAQAAGTSAIGSIPGYACYRTVEETYNSLQALATAHPNLASWTDIGDSWEKATPGDAAGYDLNVLVLTNKAIPGPKPKFMLMSAIHAREYATAELSTRFAEELVAKYNVDPDATWLLDHFELHLIPQVNPDGRKKAETGVLWRKNTDNNDGCGFPSSWGTDLNRNSNFKWGFPGSSSSACNETYRGPSASSEPEVQAVEGYADSIFPDLRGPNDSDPAPSDTEGVFITLHSYAELVLYPWGWTTTPAPNVTALQTLGRKFGYYNGYQVCNGPNCLYGTSGTTDDYTYGKLGIASYTFEVGQNFFESCSFFESNIIPKNKPALYYAFKAARRPYQAPLGPDVLTVTVSAPAVNAGDSVTLSATADDTRYNSNGWGVEPTQNIQAARYSIDLPSWKASGTVAMNPGDSSFNSNVEGVSATIDTTGWTTGRHTLFVEAQDSDGNWGVPSAVFVEITNGASTATPTATPTSTTTPLPTNTPTSTSTPVPTTTPAADRILLSSSTNGTIGGVTFADEDVIQHNVATNSWSMILDLSDVGITSDVDALARLPNGSYLMSFDVNTAVPGVGTVADSDVVSFTATSTGTTTAGSFAMYFDGSDVGLSTVNEDIDAILIAPDGRLVISTLGAFAVTGASGDDEDLVAFSPTSLGSNTSGTWSLYFDGSDVGLGEANSEDLNAGWIDSATGKIYLSTIGTFVTNSGLSGDGSDLIVCTPGTIGATTSCTWSAYWDGSVYGFGANDTDAAVILR
ncbi:MAG: M14 family metallopeptidase [Caldilineaceae bacterium]